MPPRQVKTPVQGLSIPQNNKSPRLSSSKKRFDHVKSPVAAYIHKSPQTLLSNNAKKNCSPNVPRRNFRDSIVDFREDIPVAASALPARICERSHGVKEVILIN